jgi:hypothetical protein
MAAQMNATLRQTFPKGEYFIGDHRLVTDSDYKCRDCHLDSHSGNFLAETSFESTGKVRLTAGCLSVIPYSKLCVYKEDAEEYGVYIKSKHPILLTAVNGHFWFRSKELYVYIDTNIVNKKDKFVYDIKTHEAWKYEDEEDEDEEEDEDDEDDEDEDEDEEEEDEEEDEDEDEEEEEEEEDDEDDDEEEEEEDE